MSEYPDFEDVLKELNGYSNGVHTRAYLDGVADEQSRIIKLLEELQETYAQERYRRIGGFFRTHALGKAIELIKGETE